MVVTILLAILGAGAMAALFLHWLWIRRDVLPGFNDLTSAAHAAGDTLPSGVDTLASAPQIVAWIILLLLVGVGLLMGLRAMRSYRFAVEFARRATAVSDFNQARLLDFIELSSDWLWETDAQHRFTLVSSGIRSIANMNAEIFVGRCPWEVPEDGTRADAWRDLRHKLSQHQPFTVVITRPDLAGTIRHLEFTGKPLFDAKGFIGYRGIGHDLTQQIEAEDLLRTSEARFRGLIETFFDWYWEQDESFRFTQLLTSPYNPKSPYDADFIGRTHWELANADPAGPEWSAHIEQLRAHRSFDNFIYPVRMAEGQVVWFSVTGRPTFDDSGRFTGYRGVSRDVTREHEARKALIDSEARYRTTFEHAPVGIVNSNPDGRLVSANRAFATMIGTTPEALIGKHFSEFTAQADLASDMAMMKALADGRLDSFSREKRYKHNAGRTVWAAVSICALRDEHRKLRTCIAVIQDITARVTAEKERHVVEERYRRLVDVSPDGIIVHRDQRIVFANRAAVAILGATHSENLLGQPLDAFYTRAPAMPSEVSDQNRPGTIMPAQQLGVRRADGLHTEVEVTSVVIGFDDGPAVLSLMRDVSERIAAQNALQQSRARYQEVVESVNEVIFQTTTDGTFVFLNHAWEVTTGYATASCIDRRLPDFLHPDDRRLVREQFDAILARETPACMFEARLRTHDGELRWLEGHVRPMHDPEGSIIGTMGSLDDITERKIAELTLKNLNKELEARVRARTAELEASNRELEAFSYSVSHDLRAPLRAIDGFSVILQEDLEAAIDPTTRNYLKRIRTATARMAQLIDDLIELARLTRQPLRRQNIDLSQMATEVVAELQAANPARQISVDITPGLTTNADPTLMRVVLDNLLRNAFKFTSKRALARISFFATRDEAGINFCVEDNGVGFDMNYASKLFVPFYRLHANTEFQGSGIGLATVARIIQRHGGRIFAEAAPDEGARFSFSIGH
jgi:PAS domain S-box-containing protein